MLAAVLAAGVAVQLAGCAANDAAPVRSVDDPHLRNGQPPVALRTTLDMQLDWQQQAALLAPSQQPLRPVP
ncbi:hypothetical protein [Xanthomonas bromi]|uniref:Uncharacterized protein n=1 Tax=Xanthomonas bromi TaxID=56449 RepID=A0ABX5BS13_9XANT|nr:hypothetical protein [Xanthomonas bromi]PPV07813.1 hypothetical protein XbrCFBP1976_05915 [Xanthomonas bromi]